jgi:hypothetical protein
MSFSFASFSSPSYNFGTPNSYNPFAFAEPSLQASPFDFRAAAVPSAPSPFSFAVEPSASAFDFSASHASGPFAVAATTPVSPFAFAEARVEARSVSASQTPSPAPVTSPTQKAAIAEASKALDFPFPSTPPSLVPRSFTPPGWRKSFSAKSSDRDVIDISSKSTDLLSGGSKAQEKAKQVYLRWQDGSKNGQLATSLQDILENSHFKRFGTQVVSMEFTEVVFSPKTVQTIAAIFEKLRKLTFISCLFDEESSRKLTLFAKVSRLIIFDSRINAFMLDSAKRMPKLHEIEFHRCTFGKDIERSNIDPFLETDSQVEAFETSDCHFETRGLDTYLAIKNEKRTSI